MSDVRLERWDPEDGEMTERRVRRHMEHDGYEVAVYAYRPGTVFDWHEHPEDKCDAVIEGVLRIDLDGGATFELAAGERLHVPAGTCHRAQVMGSRTVVALDGVRRV